MKQYQPNSLLQINLGKGRPVSKFKVTSSPGSIEIAYPKHTSSLDGFVAINNAISSNYEGRGSSTVPLSPPLFRLMQQRGEIGMVPHDVETRGCSTGRNTKGQNTGTHSAFRMHWLCSSRPCGAVPRYRQYQREDVFGHFSESCIRADKKWQIRHGENSTLQGNGLLQLVVARANLRESNMRFGVVRQWDETWISAEPNRIFKRFFSCPRQEGTVMWHHDLEME